MNHVPRPLRRVAFSEWGKSLNKRNRYDVIDYLLEAHARTHLAPFDLPELLSSGRTVALADHFSKYRTTLGR